MAERKPATETADRIVALRLWWHRKFDRIFDEITAPGFTGNMGMSLSVKDGRPGEPRVTIERYGITEL